MEKIFCQDIEDSEFARLDDSEKDSEFVAVESKTYFRMPGVALRKISWR